MNDKAWMVKEPGGRFELSALAPISPGENQVAVRICASGVNPLDTKIRAGRADHARQPLPAILGIDMAGIVEKAGAKVSRFRTGDAVYGMAGGVGGLQGTLAETIVVDADLLAHKPRNLSMREAAVLPLAAITAWEGLIDRAKIQEGQTVLIHAGAGGVGNIALQLARAYGAKVFATISTAKKNIVEELGAVAIDYRSLSVEQYVSSCTAGEGFDVVFDTVGGATLDASFIAVKRYTGHVLSSLGWGTHSLAPLSFRGATYSGVFTLLPLLSGNNRSHHGKILAAITALAEAGKIKPLLSQRHFCPADLESAYADVEAGSFGKVAIEIAPDSEAS